MRNFKIDGTRETPEVNIDVEKGFISFKGRSHPENSAAFFNPIIEQIQEYLKNPKPSTIIELKFEYFNSTSFKLLIDILFLLQKSCSSEHKLLVRWIYESEDEDILILGKEVERIVKLPFEFQDAGIIS